MFVWDAHNRKSNRSPPTQACLIAASRLCCLKFNVTTKLHLIYKISNQNYWVFGLSPSSGILGYRTMEKVQKSSNSDCDTPSSEPFRKFVIYKIYTEKAGSSPEDLAFIREDLSLNLGLMFPSFS
jgi:hypothetical protein